jgi:hypothetical protein
MNANIYPPRLTPKLAMEFSGQSATQLKRLRAKRAIRFYKLTNRSVVYCRDSLAAWLAARAVEPLGGH